MRNRFRDPTMRQQYDAPMNMPLQTKRARKLSSVLSIQPDAFTDSKRWRLEIGCGAMDYANQAPWAMPGGSVMAGPMQSAVYRENTSEQA